MLQTQTLHPGIPKLLLQAWAAAISCCCCFHPYAAVAGTLSRRGCTSLRALEGRLSGEKWDLTSSNREQHPTGRRWEQGPWSPWSRGESGPRAAGLGALFQLQQQTLGVGRSCPILYASPSSSLFSFSQSCPSCCICWGRMDLSGFSV